MKTKERAILMYQIDEDIEKLEIVSSLCSKKYSKSNFCGSLCNKKGKLGYTIYTKSSSLLKEKNGFAVKVKVNDVEYVTKLEEIQNPKGKVYIS